MKIPIYQVDAFTNGAFSGNPAAVCPLTGWLPDAVMQAVAAENNLSETAFFVPSGEDYELRWFTPKLEDQLCGHATLATGFVILNLVNPGQAAVRFHTRSGLISVARQGDLYAIDLPALPATPCAMNGRFVAAIGGQPSETFEAVKYLVIYNTADEVASLLPDMGALADIDRDGVIASAPGADCDFVSRYFAPHAGISEDPVTGSSHCTLVPYWTARLGKTRLHARQISRRGGELFCELKGDRVILAGRAVLYLEGEIHL